jgi:hypothetical protein
MDFKGFVDKARDAATAAAEQAKSAMATAQATSTPPPGSTEVEAAGESVELAVPGDAGPPAPVSAPSKTFAALTSEKFNELKNVGAEKIQELITSFQQALPALRSAGYELTEFEIELGVTPKLIPHFRYAAKSIEDAAAARDALRDNKLGMLILSALLKAGDVHKHIKVASFGFSHIEIELGLIPSVRLQYKNDQIAD